MKNSYFYKQFLKITEFLPKIKSSVNIKPLREEENLWV